jgi:hypothetical protein
MHVFMEALIVGILTVIIGSGVSYILGDSFKVDLPPVCDSWNEKYIKEITLFLTGIIIHLTCEFAGANKWYCKYGNACL